MRWRKASVTNHYVTVTVCSAFTLLYYISKPIFLMNFDTNIDAIRVPEFSAVIREAPRTVGSAVICGSSTVRNIKVRQLIPSYSIVVIK